MAKIKIIGSGAWGTTLAKVLDAAGHQVCIWAHDQEIVNQINQQHCNHKYLPAIKLNPSITADNNLTDIADYQYLFIVVASDYYQSIIEQLQNRLQPDQLVISATKGLTSKGEPLSEVLEHCLPSTVNYVIFSGPNIATEIAAGNPAAVVVAGKDSTALTKVQQLFIDSNLRVYSSDDVIGVELGGTLKNIIAIAAGIIDGLGLGTNTKAVIMTRGIVEITRLAKQLGAREKTLYGLSGMGDLITTCSSSKSRNHYVGESLAQSKSLSEILGQMVAVAEGVLTTRYAYQLAQKKGLEMPITEQIYKILFENLSVETAMASLMNRRQKAEDFS